jgi:hypothetical protein
MRRVCDFNFGEIENTQIKIANYTLYQALLGFEPYSHFQGQSKSEIKGQKIRDNTARQKSTGKGRERKKERDKIRHEDRIRMRVRVRVRVRVRAKVRVRVRVRVRNRVRGLG